MQIAQPQAERHQHHEGQQPQGPTQDTTHQSDFALWVSDGRRRDGQGLRRYQLADNPAEFTATA